MNLSRYIEEMKKLDTAVGIIGIVILCLFLVFVITRMLVGMRRGPGRQGVHVGMTLLSAITSYIIALILSNNIVGSLSANSFDGLIQYLEGIEQGAGEALRDAIASVNLRLIEYLTLIPATIILIPVLTILMFLVLNIIFGIVGFILIRVFKFEKSQNNTHRLIGAFLGGVEALICATILLLPFTGIASLTDQAFTSAIRNADIKDQEDLEEIYTEYITPFTQNPAITFIDKTGSRPMYNGIATVNIDGKKINVREEILDITDVVLAEVPVLEDADLNCPTDREKEAISNVVDVLYESPFMSTIMVGVLQSSASMIRNDVIDLEMGGDYQSLFDDLLTFLEGVSKESLKNDLTTIKNLYFTIADSGVLEAALEGEDLMELLQAKRREGDDTVKNMVEVLQANERTAPLVTSLTEALIATLSNSISVGGDVTVTYDEIKTGMNDVLAVKKDNYATTEEYMEVLSGTLDDTLRDNGIELEEEIVDSIAEYIDTNYSDTEDLTDEEFNDILLHYYDAYLDYLETGNIPEDIPEFD